MEEHAIKAMPAMHDGQPPSEQLASRMLVGRSIVPDSSEARRTSREAPSDAQQCRMGGGCGRRELHFWLAGWAGWLAGWAPTSFEPPEKSLVL